MDGIRGFLRGDCQTVRINKRASLLQRSAQDPHCLQSTRPDLAAHLGLGRSMSRKKMLKSLTLDKIVPPGLV